MLATVRVRLPDGTTATLAPGDVVGRMASAALILDDGRVSEAHALVSLRGAELQLLALRGLFAVDGTPTSKVALAVGQRLSFAAGLELLVEDVALPDTLPALEGDGLPRQLLSSASSLTLGPPPRLAPGIAPDADAWLWTAGDAWRLRIGGAAPRELADGEAFGLGGRSFRLTAVQVERAGVDATVAQGRVDEPLHLVTAWDTARILVAGRAPVAFSGVSARLLSVLAGVDAALSWEAVASEVWPGERDRASQRRRLDVALSRLRSRLRASGLRADLVRATGNGLLELGLYAADTVTDRS